MSKYLALGEYLSRRTETLVPMSFSDIEHITGGKLPASQRYPAWWSNNPQNNPMTKVWLDAGFLTEQVDIAGRKLVFRRASGANSHSERAGFAFGSDNKKPKEHPLFDRLCDTASITHGVNVTEPADPDWGNLAYEDDLIMQRG